LSLRHKNKKSSKKIENLKSLEDLEGSQGSDSQDGSEVSNGSVNQDCLFWVEHWGSEGPNLLRRPRSRLCKVQLSVVRMSIVVFWKQICAIDHIVDGPVGSEKFASSNGWFGSDGFKLVRCELKGSEELEELERSVM